MGITQLYHDKTQQHQIKLLFTTNSPCFCVGILRGEYNFEVSRHDEANLRKLFPVFSRSARKSHTSFLWPMPSRNTIIHVYQRQKWFCCYERRCRKVCSTRQISVFYLFIRFLYF